MTTNLGSAITHKVRKDYSKFNMVRNEPVQTHFTAEGVQVYSLADIEALKMIAERKMKGMPEGDFVRPKQYRVDFSQRDANEVLTRPHTADNWRGSLTRKNQTMVRLEKENLKSSNIQKKLFQLKQLREQARKNEPTKSSKQIVKPPRRCELDDRQIAYSPKPSQLQPEDFEVDEPAGEEAALKSELKIQRAETEGEEFVKGLDSSFEEVEMDGLATVMEEILSKSDLFQSKLNNAISSLIEQIADKPNKKGRAIAKQPSTRKA